MKRNTHHTTPNLTCPPTHSRIQAQQPPPMHPSIHNPQSTIPDRHTPNTTLHPQTPPPRHAPRRARATVGARGNASAPGCSLAAAFDGWAASCRMGQVGGLGGGGGEAAAAAALGGPEDGPGPCFFYSMSAAGGRGGRGMGWKLGVSSHGVWCRVRFGGTQSAERIMLCVRGVATLLGMSMRTTSLRGVCPYNIPRASSPAHAMSYQS